MTADRSEFHRRKAATLARYFARLAAADAKWQQPLDVAEAWSRALAGETSEIPSLVAAVSASPNVPSCAWEELCCHVRRWVEEQQA